MVQVTALYLGQPQPGASPVTHRIRIQVTDNGIGIPLSDQAKLLKPYEQVHSGGAQAGAGQGKRELGTGLGLSIAKEVVHKHGET
jgi:two-component system cell cycle sensor histidine kinase PleC